MPLMSMPRMFKSGSNGPVDVDKQILLPQERANMAPKDPDSTCDSDGIFSYDNPVDNYTEIFQIDPLLQPERGSALPSRLLRSFRSSFSGNKHETVPKKSALSSRARTAAVKPLQLNPTPIASQVCVAHRISRYLIDALEGQNPPDALFVGEKEPPISFPNYVVRLIELTNKWVEESDGIDSFGVRCALLAVDYMERVDIRLDKKSIHRYYMSAFLIAIKLLYDYYISNSFWAEVSGCPRRQVNLMEAQMCRLLRWDFTVEPSKHTELVKTFVR